MRPLSFAIGAVVLVGGFMASAQEPPSPSPSPSAALGPKAAAPKLRVPVLPTSAAPPAQTKSTQGAPPISPRSGEASPTPRPGAPPAETSSRPAAPASPVRLPGADRSAGSDPGLPRLSLEAISFINRKAVAVINGRKVMPGEMIAGARVIRILEHRVELEYQGRRFAIGF
jgi:hypothetical protein